VGSSWIQTNPFVDATLVDADADALAGGVGSALGAELDSASGAFSGVRVRVAGSAQATSTAAARTSDQRDALVIKPVLDR
jgi:hypothetical protein